MMSRRPVTEAHQRLGAEMQRRRKAAGVNTRSVPGFGSSHISSVENGYVAPSEALIELYSHLFGGRAELYALFQQMRRAAERKKIDSAAHSPIVLSQTNELTQHVGFSQAKISERYVTESHSAHCYLGSNGSINTVRCDLLLRARRTDVRLFYAGGFYDADKRPGIMSVEAVAGMSLLRTEENDAGAIKAFFLLDKPINPDDIAPYRVIYDMNVRSEKKAMPQLVFYSRPGTVRFDLSVTFSEEMPPKRLWHFGARNIVSMQHSNATELSPISGLTYVFEFVLPVPDWCYGFSWLW